MLSDEQLQQIRERAAQGYIRYGCPSVWINAKDDVESLLAHVAKLTAILDSGKRVALRGLFNDWVVSLPDGASHWHQGVASEWPITDTGSTQTSTLGKAANTPQDAAGGTT